MPFDHTFLSQRYHQWYLRPELFDLFFDCLSYLQDRTKISFFEESRDSCQDSNTLLYKLLCRYCIECFPFSIEPFFTIIKPLIGCYPEITKGSEVSYHCLYLAIICRFRFEEYLSGVVLLSILIECSQVLVNLHT